MKQTKTPKVFSLGKECPMCGQKAYLRITEEEENQWRKYACFGGHIQDRFPDMDVQKREFIKSGYCPDCQKALFGTEYGKYEIIGTVFHEYSSDEYALKEALETRDLISPSLKGKLLQMIEEMEKFVIESPEKCTKTMQSMKKLLIDTKDR